MSFKTKYFPVGALAYGNIEPALRMMAKLFEKIPFVPELPKIMPDDNIDRRTLENIPGISFDGKKIVLKTGSEKYKEELKKLEKAFNNPTKENLAPFEINSELFTKFEHLIKRFKAPYACVNLWGPFTISQKLKQIAEDQMLADKSFRKLFIQAVTVKALWAIERIKEIHPETIPVIILEEPKYTQLGDIKRENEEITVEVVTNLFSKVIEKIKTAGGLCAVQCMEKCDWKIPINAGVDIILFDAYNNPNNLCIIPETVTEFLERGGKIVWGIVPTMSETVVKNINLDTLEKRLLVTLDALCNAGVSRKLVYNSAMVSIQGDTQNLPLIFAEKSMILATQLAKKIPHVKEKHKTSES